MKLHRVGLGSILLLLIILLAACNGKREKPLDPREMQVRSLQAKITEMESSVNQMRNQLSEAQSVQVQLAEKMTGMQNSLNEIQGRMAESRTALNTLSQAEQEAKARENRGWPWLVRILLILALLVVFYFIWRKVIRGSDVDDETADEGFVEETDLGTVRYPGTKSDSSRKKE